MINQKSVKNIGLLGNNFHTVIDKYLLKLKNTAMKLSKNEI